MERIPLARGEVLEEIVRYRRLMGLVLGLAIGLVYGVVSQLANPLTLPGIPLYQPPLGAPGNILLLTLWGGILGLLCSWPDSTALGVLLPSLASTAVLLVRGFWGLPDDPQRLLVTGITLGFPVFMVTLPVMGILRWTVDSLGEMRGRPVSWWEQVRGPLLLLACVAIIAAFSVANATARSTLTNMDAMLQAGLATPTPDRLPEPLQAPAVGDFQGRARARYTLEWTETDLDRFIELRPAGSYDQHSAVIARFGGGWTLVCLYPTAEARPNCGAY